jgi:hypothetical protein
MRFTLDTVGKLRWPEDSQGRPLYPEGFEDLARKLGRQLHPPGRDVRCIVSVGMLTEGWDCSTVTHIVGLRPFMSQLLCEQVVGRGLRRASYELGANDRLTEEVAKVFGVPFEIVLARDLTRDYLEHAGPHPPAHALYPQVVAIALRYLREKAEVDFWTSREVREVSKSHLNYVTADTKVWEEAAAYAIDTHAKADAFVKNAGLGFAIPYLHNGQFHDYVPDFIIRLKTDPVVHLILETKGYDERAEIKAQAAERWVKAVSADSRHGVWKYAWYEAPARCHRLYHIPAAERFHAVVMTGDFR